MRVPEMKGTFQKQKVGSKNEKCALKVKSGFQEGKGHLENQNRVPKTKAVFQIQKVDFEIARDISDTARGFQEKGISKNKKWVSESKIEGESSTK